MCSETMKKGGLEASVTTTVSRSLLVISELQILCLNLLLLPFKGTALPVLWLFPVLSDLVLDLAFENGDSTIVSPKYLIG